MDALAHTVPGGDLVELDDLLWVLHRLMGQAVYDFEFGQWFPCRRPYGRPRAPSRPEKVVLRIGAVKDYEGVERALAQTGFALINSRGEHLRATELPRWYPLLEDLTPKSLWFEGPPDPVAISEELGWPVFMKGARQTHRHKRSHSFIDGPVALGRALAEYAQDPVLSWQDIVCRELVPLRPVEDPDPARIPSSFEFRTFWWKGTCVGIGRYWSAGLNYTLTGTEEQAALAIASEAARRVAVPFLVVDVAQTAAGRWIVIECNDGQESGYAGVSPMGLWNAVLDLERP